LLDWNGTTDEPGEGRFQHCAQKVQQGSAPLNS